MPGDAGLVFLCAALLCAGGCGYATSSLVSAGSKTIYVRNFVNKIDPTQEVTDKRMYVGYRSGLELSVTRETINKFIVDGNLKIADEKTADLILEGELVDFRKEALRFDANDDVIEFRLKVVVDMRLTDSRTGKLITEEKYFTGETTYRTSGTLAKSESQAVQAAVADLAQRVVERVVEGW